MLQTLSFSALILFGVICCIAATILSELVNRVDRFQTASFSSHIIFQELNHRNLPDDRYFIKLMELYDLICDFIEHLSGSFGLILLIGTAYTFVGFIAASFIIISSLKSLTWAWHTILYLINHTAATLVLFVILHRISIKVYTWS